MSQTRQPPMLETMAGKHLLVTGVTGFLGKVWVGLVLEHLPSVERLTLLVRKSRRQTAEERVKEIVERSPALRPLRERGAEAFRELVNRKLRVVEADISLPLCGLELSEAQTLMSSVDVVVHFAGLTDFAPDPLAALATNVRGATNVADLAELTAEKRLLHVSTAYVAGSMSGEVPESLSVDVTPNGTKIDPKIELDACQAECEIIELRADRIERGTERAKALGYPNLYTYSKGLAELLLANRTDLQVAIVRPSIVESSESFPMPGWNEGINTSGPLVWLLSTAFRRLPAQPETHFDVVPVDHVAKAILMVVAASLRGEAEPVYQLASGWLNPLKFERAIDLTGLACRRLHQDDDAKPHERLLYQFMDAVPRGTDRDTFPSWNSLISISRKLHRTLGNARLERVLPPAMHDKHAETIDPKLKKLSGDFRQAAKTMVRIEQMLDAFKPFIYDNNYRFHTEAIRRANETLHYADAELAFAIGQLNWRDYWVRTHVPGLKKWCFPLMRGDKPPLDPPLPQTSTHLELRDAKKAPANSLVSEPKNQVAVERATEQATERA